VISKNQVEKDNFHDGYSRVNIFSNTYCESLEVNGEVLLHFLTTISAFQALALKAHFLPNL
jgi:hypothetical protein